jgi:hypothetical protein
MSDWRSCSDRARRRRFSDNVDKLGGPCVDARGIAFDGDEWCVRCDFDGDDCCGGGDVGGGCSEGLSSVGIGFRFGRQNPHHFPSDSEFYD